MRKLKKNKLVVNSQRIRVLREELSLVCGGVLPTSKATCVSDHETDCCPPDLR